MTTGTNADCQLVYVVERYVVTCVYSAKYIQGEVIGGEQDAQAIMLLDFGQIIIRGGLDT
jgi:hypothetical protein